MDRNLVLEYGGKKYFVVPYVGTWIEIWAYWYICPEKHVVPYVGTWIEIEAYAEAYKESEVVPYVGTWIEICID